MPILTSKQDSVYRALRDKISGGEYTAGSAIPTEYQLIDMYGVSRTIVRLSLSRLEQEGLIIRRKGSGSYVSEEARKVIDGQSSKITTRVGFVYPPMQLNNQLHVRLLTELEALLLQGIGLSLLFDEHPQFERYAALGIDLCVLDGGLLDGCRSVPLGWSGRLVVINRVSQKYNYISTDNFVGGEMLARYLLQLGHRRIGIINYGLNTDQDFVNRLEGIYSVFAEEGITPALDLSIQLHEYRAFTPHAAAEQMLTSVQKKEVTGVICITDNLTYPVYDIAEEFGLRIGEDFSLIGFDNHPSARFFLPPLTTIRHPLIEMAAKLDTIVKAFADGNRPFCACKIPPVLIERSSTKRVSEE